MKTINLIVLALVAICLLAAPLVFGQGGNPPASTKESGSTSSHGMTAVEQTGKGGESVEQQIKTLMDKTVQAQLKGDTSFYEKYYADEAMMIHGIGKLSTRLKKSTISSPVLSSTNPMKFATRRYTSMETRRLRAWRLR